MSQLGTKVVKRLIIPFISIAFYRYIERKMKIKCCSTYDLIMEEIKSGLLNISDFSNI